MTDKADRSFVGMTVTDAIKETLESLDKDEKERVRAMCNLARSSLYQLGEYNEAGEPRMKLAAHMVPTFCAATGSTLVLELIQHQTAELLEGRGQSRQAFEEVTEYEVLKEIQDVVNTCITGLLDGQLSPPERRGLWRELREAIDTLRAYEESQDSTVDFKRAKTIRDAENRQSG